MPGEEEAQQPVEVSMLNLDRPEVLSWLAALVAISLKKTGIVTFFVDDVGRVQFANPKGVYLDVKQMQAPEKPFRFVRPILTDRKPQFVAFRDDGSLWEIEFIEEREGDGT